MKKEIDYYGTEDNYIHLKFGDARKCYNFTDKLIERCPDFTREYKNYFEGEKSKFKNPFQVVSYVYDKKIPVHFYYNYTDTPAKNRKEIIKYLINENCFVGDLS